jgi:feruloyl-CoA synthase
MKTRLPKLLDPRINLSHFDDGSFTVESAYPLDSYERCIGEWLEKWAVEKGDQVFLAQKINGAWHKLNYQLTRTKVGQIAQGLLNLGLDDTQPIVILSENSIDNALLTLAAMHIGVPVATVSSAYALMSDDCERLSDIINTLKPSLIYASSGTRYANALSKIQFDGKRVVSEDSEALSDTLSFAELFSEETPAVMAAFNTLTHDTHARYLLTSGSTGTPKVVINTHRMLCSNQQQIAQAWPFVEEVTLRVLEWLPWSHTFGANHNFNLILRNGGEFYIDDGRPMPGMIDTTVENIKEVRPNLFFNVPRGFEVLVSIMEKDLELRKALFKDLILVFYAGAALPMATWNRMREMAFDVRGDLPFFTSSWGATETAPAITNIYFEMDKTSNLGLPLPGLVVKFVPSGEKLEMRVKGPSIFPGYRNNPEKTKDAFDEEGFYKIEDAGKFIDPERPELGIAFDGRVTEDFKLTTGTWVSVGTLRPALTSKLSPFFQDFIICGHNEDSVGALGFITPALTALAGAEAENLPPHKWSSIPAVKEMLIERMKEFKKEHSGSSQHIRSLLILDMPPNIKTGEITDKGYINQRVCLREHAEEVKKLYSNDDINVVRI